MMKMRLASVLIAAAIAIAAVFAACGEDKNTSKTDEKKTAETTAVIETVSDGGTVEQDADGNRITKNVSGKVVAVEDKNGNPIDVEEYLTTHSWVESGGSAGSGGSEVSDGSGSGSGKKSSGGDSPANKSDKDSSAADQTEGVEEEIPVVIATIPDESDIIVIPDV